MDVTEMAVSKLKFDILDFSSSIFGPETGLVLNPSNNRDWSDYEVSYDPLKGFKAVGSKANELLQSLLYEDENGDYNIKVVSPIVTTTKAVGQAATGIPGYIIAAGNSRAVLLDNLQRCFHAITDPGFQIKIVKLNHDIDPTLTADDLLIEQIRNNTSVAMEVAQQYQLINIYLANLPAEMKKGDKVAAAMRAFGLSQQTIYIARRFGEFPDWFQALTSSIFVRNAEILDKINSLHLKAVKQIPDLTLMALWEDLQAMASVAAKPVTDKTLSTWEKENLASKDNPTFTPEETEQDGEPGEPGETVSTGETEEHPGIDWASGDESVYDLLQSYLDDLVLETDEESGEPLLVACHTTLWDNLTARAYSGKNLIAAGKALISYHKLMIKVDSLLTTADIETAKAEADRAKAQAKADQLQAESDAELAATQAEMDQIAVVV